MQVSDPDGTISAYLWKEGNSVLGTQQTLSLDNLSVGIHQIILTITDNVVVEDTDTVFVTVESSKPPDITPPIISLNGSDLTLYKGDNYIELGATAIDDIDGSVDVTVSGVVDTSTAGDYIITYTANDLSGNTAIKTRNISVLESQIVFISPDINTTVQYNLVTLQVKKTDTNGDSVIGIKAHNKTLPESPKVEGELYGDTYLFRHIPLKQGSNTITVTGNNGAAGSTLEITSEGKGLAPVNIEVNKTFGVLALAVSATIFHPELEASNYYIDTNNDQSIDYESTVSSHEFTYDSIGAKTPRVIVKTTDNILYSSIDVGSQTLNILQNLEPSALDIPSIDAAIKDIEDFGKYVFALTTSNIFKVSKEDLSQVETIPLLGFTNPNGFTITPNGDIFIADTGSNRVIKLLASSNYEEDTKFILNTEGTGDGELLSPWT